MWHKLAAPPPGPISTRLQGWIDWAYGMRITLFMTTVFIMGVVLLVRTRGSVSKIVLFALGAVIVFMLLNGIDSISGTFKKEFFG